METPLEMARRHVAEGERLVAEQQALIVSLRADGHPTDQAEEFLAALLRTLAECKSTRPRRTKGHPQVAALFSWANHVTPWGVQH